MPFTENSAPLLSPPPGQTASVNSLPKEDPAMQKGSAGRIQSVYESLVGFFETDAPGLQKLGDASIQLPLSTSKSDLGRLNDELNVLKRNPGLESTLTTEDINGIEANLGYLQKKWRLSVNARSGAPSPMPPTQEEAFSDCTRTSSYGWFRSFFGGNYEGFADTGSNGNGSNTNTVRTTTGSLPAVTYADLEDLTLKLSIEIVRLQGSGATDTNTQSRISVLTAIKQKLDDLISDVRNNIRDISTVPLTKADISKFLPAISNQNTAIPDLLNDFGLQSVLSSLFPNYSLGDVSGADLSKKLFNTYLKDMTQNLSWDVNLSYKGQAEQDIAANNASAMKDARYSVDNTGTPTAGNSTIPDATNSFSGSSISGYRGVLSSVVSSLSGQDATVTMSSDGTPISTQSGSTTSGPFNWQERSTQICNQITARGMSSYDFGCMKPSDKVKDNFSWRGYTRMVCTRLGTVYDPSIPELCGCPPLTWAGWRH